MAELSFVLSIIIKVIFLSSILFESFLCKKCKCHCYYYILNSNISNTMYSIVCMIEYNYEKICHTFNGVHAYSLITVSSAHYS